MDEFFIFVVDDYFPYSPPSTLPIETRLSFLLSVKVSVLHNKYFVFFPSLFYPHKGVNRIARNFRKD
ncbi:hypothetical protein DERP_008826 [Dermatophagoides pteronyssinus]|uniref:Uncharacterized protein n=1 Tax=Dermatophagoides pteronyssinus TaxID=6956 RepID=A0ABQ8IWE7_DERPT|nr:hypothetical protein DERP_008826 [Dermatophagoides pteronyssinus]